MGTDPQYDMVALTTKVIASYTSNNIVTAQAIPDLIRTVHAAFASLASGAALPPLEDTSVPATPIERSVFNDYIICLEDGRKLKMLKRHLSTVYNMTPEQYRERWNLPRSYPMTAPAYAAHRSSLAKQSGLGLKPISPKTPGGTVSVSAQEATLPEPTVTRTTKSAIKTGLPDLNLDEDTLSREFQTLVARFQGSREKDGQADRRPPDPA
jgi:predicted transcriptional regulator